MLGINLFNLSEVVQAQTKQELHEAMHCVPLAVTTILPGRSLAELRAATADTVPLAKHKCYSEHLAEFKQLRAAHKGKAGDKRLAFDCTFADMRIAGAVARRKAKSSNQSGAAEAVEQQQRAPQLCTEQDRAPALTQAAAPRGSAAAKAAQRKAKRKGGKGSRRVNTSELD